MEKRKTDINKLFEHKYTLKSSSETFPLPKEENCFSENIWEIDSLQQLKHKLIECKSMLNNYDIREWGKHTSMTDLSSLIIKQIECHLQSKPHLLTRAWIKFYEILSNYKLIPQYINDTIDCLFICEAPGAFITSFNHYIKCNNPNLSYHWIGNSLNPYYEGIDNAIVDDRFIRDVNCYENWCFCSTNTGDILDENILYDIQRKAKDMSMKKFDVITADGGINCIDAPESQENILMPLIFAEIFIALNMLNENGSFVMKCFTVFECQTICSLYLLSSVFNEVHLFKPIASKCGNSEVYVICLGFNAPNLLHNVLRKFSIIKTDQNMALFSRKSIDSRFIDSIEKCMLNFSKIQMNTIEDNLRLFSSVTPKEKSRIMKLKRRVANYFIHKYNIENITLENRLSRVSEYHYNYIRFKRLSNFVLNYGSYNERKEQKSNSESFKRLWIRELNQRLNEEIYSPYLFYNWNISDLIIPKIKYVTGKSFREIKHSKFSDLSLLNIYNKCAEFIHMKTFVNVESNTFYPETENALKYLLSKNEITESPFQYVVNCDLKSQLTSLIVNLFKDKPIIVNDLTSDILKDNRKIIIIDCCNGSSISQISTESNILLLSVSHICKIIPIINSNDLLLIHIGTSLTRLTTGVLYIMTQLFRKYAFIPCLMPEGLPLQHGILCLYYGKCDESIGKNLDSQFIELNTRIINDYGKSFTSNESSNMLLEIIPPPALMSDIRFYELIFNANSVHILEYLKFLSTNTELNYS